MFSSDYRPLGKKEPVTKLPLSSGEEEEVDEDVDNFFKRIQNKRAAPVAKQAFVSKSAQQKTPKQQAPKKQPKPAVPSKSVPATSNAGYEPGRKPTIASVMEEFEVFTDNKKSTLN